MSEVEKLKTIALNKEITWVERMNAIDLLGDVETKEAMLALLDVANKGLTYSERMNTQDKVTNILRKLKEKGKI